MTTPVNKRPSPEANQPFEQSKRQRTEGSLNTRTVTTISPEDSSISSVQKATSSAAPSSMDQVAPVARPELNPTELHNHYVNRDFHWIKEHCKPLVEAYPDMGFPQLYLGLALYDMGNFVEAIESLTRGIKAINLLLEDKRAGSKLNDFLLDCYHKLGVCYYEQKSYVDTIAILTKMSFKNTQYYSHVMFLLGTSHKNLESYGEAINYFTEVSSEYKDYFLSLYLIGQCHLKLGFPTTATSYFLQIPPHDKLHAHALASIFEASLKTSSGTIHPFYYSSLKDNFKKGNHDWIIENCGQVKEDIEWYLVARVFLGFSLAITKQYEKAKEVLIEVIRDIELPPEDHSIFIEMRLLLDQCYHDLSYCLLNLNEFSEAIRCLRQISKIPTLSEHPQSLYQRAQENIGECKQKALEKEKSVNPLFANASISTHPAHLCAMGSEYFSSGKNLIAEHFFNQVLPDSGQYYTYALEKLKQISDLEPKR
jgi:tetratricopeptide (TPR) repeat protein